MVRKLAYWGIAAAAAFYLIASPTVAGNTVKHAGNSLQHAAHQVATFLKALG